MTMFLQLFLATRTARKVKTVISLAVLMIVVRKYLSIPATKY